MHVRVIGLIAYSNDRIKVGKAFASDNLIIFLNFYNFLGIETIFSFMYIYIGGVA